MIIKRIKKKLWGEGYGIEILDSVEANRKNEVCKFYKTTKYI
jgi:hypothetical protein